MKEDNECPKCGSPEFITEPNQCDILQFDKSDFDVIRSESTNDFQIFCQECYSEIDQDASLNEEKIVLKNSE